MTVKEIVTLWLKTAEYDGLYQDGDCACALDDLMPCMGEGIESCKAGHKIPCDPETCEVSGDCEWHIGVKNDKRKGDWFQIYSGRAFWVLDPRAEDVCIEDIAHHLALQCRFNGATREFYSVAHHSVLVSHLLECVEGGRELPLWGLLHDAAEAYLGDMVRPLKLSMPEYREAEARVMSCIVTHFGLDPEQEPKLVKWADNVLLATERRDLMGPRPLPWTSIENVEPLAEHIVPWSPLDSEDGFMERFKELVL